MDTTETGEKAAKAGTKKERSPSFPFIGLSRSLERARQVYAAAKRFEARVPEIASAWGLGSRSSGTLQTIAALLAYGLLEDEGAGENRKLKLTDLAFKALEDQRPGAREAALAEAAMKPKLIAEYATRWRDGRPSDTICVSELRIDRGFTDDGARAFLKVFDDALRFAPTTHRDKNLDKEDANHTTVKVGDLVQWTSSGIDQFKNPAKVVGISGDGHWLWVAESKTGIPMAEVTVLTTGADIDQPPPPIPPEILNTMAKRSAPASGYKEEKTSLDEGEAILSLPENLSAASVLDIEYWFDGIIRKAKRRAGMT